MDAFKITIEYNGEVLETTVDAEVGDTEESVTEDVLKYVQVYVEAVPSGHSLGNPQCPAVHGGTCGLPGHDEVQA